MSSSLKATIGLTSLSQPTLNVPMIPSVSPNGARVVYRLGLTASTFDIFSSPVDGSAGMLRHSSPAAGGSAGLSIWAHDSSRVFYRSDQDVAGQFEIYSADPAGGPNIKISGTVVAGGGATTTMSTK